MKQFISASFMLRPQRLVQQLKNNHFIRKGTALALVAVVTGCMVSQSSSAQSFQKGSNIINLGIGLGTTLYGSGYTHGFPPISVSYERGIADGRWGIGGYLARTSAKWGDKDDYWKFSYTVIGVRGDYHFYTTDKLDTYGGLMLGYDIVSDKWHGEGEEETWNGDGSEVAYSLFVGGRYYFSDHVGVFAELGYGVAVLNIGLAFNL